MSKLSREEFESILEEAYIEGYNNALEDIQENYDNNYNENAYFIKNIKPDINYTCNNESFINIINQTKKDIDAIKIYTEGFTIKGYKIDFSKIIEKVTSAIKNMYFDFFKKIKEIYIKALAKVGQYLSSKGLNSFGANVSYEWTKVDFNKLESYIDEFGNDRGFNMLKGYLSTTSNDDVDYNEKIDITTYLGIMSSNKYRGIFNDNNSKPYEELKYQFSSKQKTISVNKNELTNMYKKDILSCLNKLYNRTMNVQSKLNKWINDELEPEHEFRERQKNELLRQGKKLSEVYGNNRGSTEYKVKRAKSTLTIALDGNIKFMNLMFKLIIYGFHQQIMATIAAIKSTKLNRDKINQQKLLAAPAI